MGTVANPVIRKIKDDEENLEIFEKERLAEETDKVKDIITNFPTVYIHSWSENGKYEVYVGESNNIFNRTREHYYNQANNENWQHRLTGRNACLYIIGHEHFNKSLTLDIENRLIHYLMSVNKVQRIHNGRNNPQTKYYPIEEFEAIFRKIWRKLHQLDKELFPSECAIKDSAIYKASPLHKLTRNQEKSKLEILDKIYKAVQKDEKQIIFIDGEAGTGKTVLNSSLFYELFCCDTKAEGTNLKINVVVNHDEQVKVYLDIAKKLGIIDKYGEVVSKASKFLHKHPEKDSVDVVLIDEAHLLFTQGNQGYSGKNQLNDIVERTKVTVIVFDENQILRMDQYWENFLIEKYRNTAIDQKNYLRLTEQLRMDADKATLSWIDSFTKDQMIKPLPKGSYEIRIFDSPKELESAIIKKAKKEESRLSRIIANYDWDYKNDSKPPRYLQKYWEVSVNDWHRPWNYQLEKELGKNQKRNNAGLSWAEQKHTIGEIGSTYTIQGFDLNYAGVILGESVKFRDGKIVYDPSKTSNSKVRIAKTMSDGTKQNFARELLKHEVRVLMTRGVNGLYIYACDDQLRTALQQAAR